MSESAMQPALVRDDVHAAARAAPRRGVSVAAAVALIVVGVLALYWKTTWSMVVIWSRSETFAHGFVVLPIFAYLLWRERRELADIETRPCWPAMAGVAAMGMVWLVGDLVSAASVSQLAMVAMIPFAVWTILGTRVVSALAIPLAFLLFLVPFGEFLVPTLMDRTADFTVGALRASGVPVYREGNFFIIPSGAWSVVEACSGLRYLIASLMVGCLYAYLTYRSTLRRVLFIVAAVVVPIVANWLRADMIVMIGHLSSNRLAVGADHLIYGWVFFGVVIALLLFVASRWREDDKPMPAKAPRVMSQTESEAPPPHAPRNRWLAPAAAFALMALWQPLSGKVDASDPNPVALTLVAASHGWVALDEPIVDWRPDLSGAAAELRQTFVKDGRRVGVHIALYKNQTPEAKAVTSTNQIVRTTNKKWRRAATGSATPTVDGTPVKVSSSVIVGPAARLALWHWYWIDAHATSNDYIAKLYQALSVLERHGDAVAWVVVYTDTASDGTDAQAVLQAFVADMSHAIDTTLMQASGE